MSRQANGTYIQPANTAAVSGQTISSTAFNTLITDVGTEITNSLDRQGRSAMQAALPMGNNKITGLADPTVSTDAVTKNYADSAISAFFSTGDCKLTLKTVADSGWIMATNGTTGHTTVGSGSSGATYANANTQALFNLLYANVSDADAPIQTSGGAATTRAAQTNAATAWAANCRIQVGWFAARTLGVAGNPPDLSTSRPLGNHIGADTAALATSNLPPYTPTGNVNTGSVAFNGANVSSSSGGGNSVTTGAFSATGALNLNAATISGFSFTGNAQGGTSVPFSIYQPTSFINMMVKL